MDSSAYENIKNHPRPGHGDYTWHVHFVVSDYRGGGRGSKAPLVRLSAVLLKETLEYHEH